ncbi:MAG TPA: hypothetical protein PKA98_22055, partial [Acidimicrobiales bacterium]|nr:hypothetical protein [Acidimicrobiales bacterium]
MRGVDQFPPRGKRILTGRNAVLVLALVGASLVPVVGAGPGVSPVAADGNEAPGSPAAFRGLTAGAAHTCAIVTTSGQVKCWGENADGRLGLGDTADRGDDAGEMGASLPSVDLGTGRTATALAAGEFHTCALLDNSRVKCWGANFGGQLGLGDTDPRGDGPGEMGDSLPTVDLGAGRTATAITAGRAHTCALLDNATVKCWGLNTGGELGLGDNNHRGDAPGEMGNALPVVSLGSGRTATTITSGYTHTCARLDNATLKC